MLQVSDDGIGTARDGGPEGDGKPLGYRLMEAFAHQLNGQLSISSDGGTVVTLRLDFRSLTEQGFSPAQGEPRKSPVAA